MENVAQLNRRLSTLYKDRMRFQEGVQSNHGLTVKIGGSEIDLGENTESRIKDAILKTLEVLIEETKEEMITALKDHTWK